MDKIKLFSCLLAATLSTGCIPIRSKGTTHYLVIGLGVVSVNNTNKEVAHITRANALGVFVSKERFSAGYAAETMVSVKTNENIALEIKQAPFRSLSICVPKQ